MSLSVYKFRVLSSHSEPLFIFSATINDKNKNKQLVSRRRSHKPQTSSDLFFLSILHLTNNMSNGWSHNWVLKVGWCGQISVQTPDTLIIRQEHKQTDRQTDQTTTDRMSFSWKNTRRKNIQGNIHQELLPTSTM